LENVAKRKLSVTTSKSTVKWEIKKELRRSEPILRSQWVGLGLFVGCVLSFGWGMRSPSTPGRDITVSWLVYLALLFLGNGMSLLLLKAISKQAGNHDFFLPFIPFYMIAATGSLVIARAGGARLPGLPELTIGVAAALSAMLGNVLLYVAISKAAASALPIIHGFSILVVCAGSVLFFGERFSWPKALGTLLGMASITLLAHA
jgi:drug/metabolite transporter (DMT)-like permease